jgi:lipopolysaccharide biosynthesis glycosyltransferase
VSHGPPPAADAVHVALVLGKGGLVSASVLIASLLEHASRPLHVAVLARGGTDGVDAELAARFPELSLTWIPARGVGRGLGTPTGERPPPQALIRLLLPDLLPNVDRVVVLPLPSVATGDVAELAGLDLGGHALAAPPRPDVRDASGFGVIHAAALRLGDRNRAASALRRTAHARHAFDFDAFATDVLVLDLERLRRERFTEQALPLVQEFGLDDAEVLHYLFGPDHAVVPQRWALVPTRAPERGAGLLHWADAVKPWQQPLTPRRDAWRHYAATFARA